jgi:Ecdysteroid kinase-like family
MSDLIRAADGGGGDDGPESLGVTVEWATQILSKGGKDGEEYKNGKKTVAAVRAAPLLGDKLNAASELVRVDVDVVSGGETGEKSVVSLVLKRSPVVVSGNRKELGLTREALFYRDLAPAIAASAAGLSLPEVFSADGDMATGSMEVVMEFLPNAVPAGVLFGGGNPNNWALGAEKLAAAAEGNPGARELTEKAFSIYAALHAAHWGSKELLDGKHEWLRGTQWMRGEGEESWRAAIEMAGASWRGFRSSAAEGKEEGGEKSSDEKTDADADAEAKPRPGAGVKWDAHLVACLDASFAKVDWVRFQASLAGKPFSLVHGDAHPHNFMWAGQRTRDARLVMVDFEMVGVGSPAQDLGQFMISHTSPAERRASERDLVAHYHRALQAHLSLAGGKGKEGKTGKDIDAEVVYTLEQCWDEYVAGGIGRWAWFVPLFLGAAPPVAQFFHDQLAAFLHDHMADPAQMPMPRV